MVDGWGWCYAAGMEFTDWMWIKFGALCAAAFIWGVYRGFIGKPLHLEQNELRRERRGPAIPTKAQAGESPVRLPAPPGN